MIRPQMQVVFEEDVEIFVAGLAVPSEFIDEMHERGMKVIVMIGKRAPRRRNPSKPAPMSSPRRARRPAATPARSARWRSCRRSSTP